MNNNKIALVTGANRGIGFETVRQLVKMGIKVILTSRNENKGKSACKSLKKEGINVFFQQLDVIDQESIKKAHQNIEKKFGELDILINNAGINIDKGKGVLDIDLETFSKTIETNVYGPLLVSQAFIPLMKKNNYGRIVNVSSELGQLSSMSGGWPSYRVSKTALNALNIILASRLKQYNILVNSASPGWTKTDMGGAWAPRTVEEGVDTIVWLATLPDDGPTGLFFKDRRKINW